MKTLTPKGKKALITAGVVSLIFIAWAAVPLIRSRISSGQPEEFRERPHTEFVNFYAKLPHQNEHYRVYYDEYYSELVIVPIVEIDNAKNPIEEFDRVWPTYEQYALEAISWIKAEGGNLADFSVSFWGEDFWPTGRKISY